MTRTCPTRREFLGTAVGCCAATMEAFPLTTRSFWLFRLLRPQCVLVRPVANGRLHCSDRLREWIVEGNEPLCIRKNTSRTRITGPDGSAVLCTLEMPGALCRVFSGTFEFRGGPDYLLPILYMDCETATNCVVAAELPVSTAHFHALAAQAVVSRSVIRGTRAPQHAIADFCDTTHCQFLRSPSERDSITARAVQQTRGCVLAESGEIMPCRYSAACGGQTEAGFEAGHRYFSVRCETCRQKGTARRGHGWGLCQEGAMGLAQRGFSWPAILAKYYPNANPVRADG